MHIFVPLGITMTLQNSQPIHQTAEKTPNPFIFRMENVGLEPTTSALQGRRSPSELIPHKSGRVEVLEA